ncbi:MAG TPA: hypothetical protein PK525_13520, partial [Anaerohalosphaeraceae bacterium]|nr:hypothetical protein [Anaerohalosphaeraceae bacterium]
HNSVLQDGGRDYLVYHAYDAQNRGMSILQIRPLVWDSDGWPHPEEPLECFNMTPAAAAPRRPTMQ